MKLLSYEAHNVMGVRDIKFDLRGRHLFLVGGKNEQGKSSSLKALLMTLCGKRGMDDYPEVALRDGEDKGHVTVYLSGEDSLHEEKGLAVQLFFRRKRDKSVMEEFHVIDSAGEEAPEPRALLKRLYNLKAFDPLAFERLDKKAKRAMLLDLLGLDFKAEDKEYNTVFTARRDAKRDEESLFDELAKLPMPHVGLPEKEVDAAELLAELERRRAVNAKNADLVIHAENLSLEAGKKNSSLQQAQEELEAAKAKVKAAKEAHGIAHKEWAAAQGLADAVVNESLEEVSDKISTATETNKKIAENQARVAHQAKLESKRTEIADKAKRLEAIIKAKEDAIAQAKWPLPNMGFDDEGVLLDGRPLEQASKKQRIITSAKIGMALNPTLRLLVCEDGGDMDEDALAAFDELLRDNDFQAIVELVTRGAEDEARCAVVIKAGEVVERYTGSAEDAAAIKAAPDGKVIALDATNAELSA